MSITTPGERVDAPACVPLRYGLLSVAEVDDRADGHWGLGFHHEQLTCEDIESRVMTCPPDNEPKDTDSDLDFPESDPLTLIAPFKCATGRMTLARAWELADQRLERGEARAIEKAFWTGLDTAGNPIRQTLGGSSDVVDLTPVAGAVDITGGLAMLESWAGEFMPCGPIIHAQRGIGVYLAERNLTEAQGQVLYSKGTGSRVSLGGGYQATGAQGPVPGGTFSTTVDDAMTAFVLLDDCVEGVFVDWGDGLGPVAEVCPVDPADPIVHVYAADDTYEITVTGPGGFSVGPVTVTTGTDESQDVEGTGTPAVTAGESWMFVTGSIKILRGPKFNTPEPGDLAGAVDRLVNDITVFAERNYAFEYECGVAAVRVRLNTCCGCSDSGGGGDVDGGTP